MASESPTLRTARKSVGKYLNYNYISIWSAWWSLVKLESTVFLFVKCFPSFPPRLHSQLVTPHLNPTPSLLHHLLLHPDRLKLRRQKSGCISGRLFRAQCTNATKTYATRHAGAPKPSFSPSGRSGHGIRTSRSSASNRPLSDALEPN